MGNGRQTDGAQDTDTLPQDWFDRAREAAERLNIPMPENQTTAAEAEQRLTQFEQRGGE